jgi:hypothetical protein
MIGMVTHYNTKEHTIVGGEINDFCNRIVASSDGKRKLFVVHYNLIGVFVIAEWVGKVGDVFVDVMNLGNSMANFTREKAKELQKRVLAPDTCRATEVMLKSAESDHLHQMQDENAEEQERLQRVARGE